MMGGRHRLMVVVAALLVVGACGGDDGSGQLVIENRIDFQGQGTFEVTEGGEALGCLSGTVSAYVTFADGDLPETAEETYTCASGDRQGTFTVYGVVDEADASGSTATWTITAATGDFTGMEGSGETVVEVASDHTNGTITGEYTLSE